MASVMCQRVVPCWQAGAHLIAAILLGVIHAMVGQFHQRAPVFGGVAHAFGHANAGRDRRTIRAQAQAAGLEVVDELAFGPDYAETLAQWRTRFLKAEAEVLALGFDQRFLRIWEFYLAYCEAAFAEGNTSVMQFTLRKPG